MGKKKKKGQDKVPADLRTHLDRIAAELAGRLPTDEPAALFEDAADSAGYRAELIDALARLHSKPALDFLYQLVAALTDKSLIKSARRAIYRLEQKGLRADERFRAGSGSIIKPPPPRQAIGYLGEYDESGMRIGILALPAPSSGYHAALFMDAYEGLADFYVWPLSGGELRRLIKEMSDQSQYGLLEVRPGHVRLVLAEAATRSQRLGRAWPEEYPDFLTRLHTVPLPERPAIYDYLDEDDLADRIDLKTGISDLLSNPMTYGLIYPDELATCLTKLEELNDSLLILSESQKNDRREVILDQAALDLFGEERRARLKRQLEEIALWMWLSDRAELAEAAVAVVLDLDRESDPVKPSAFPRILLSTAVERHHGVEPDLADQEAEPLRTETRTDSGLIIPDFVKM